MTNPNALKQERAELHAHLATLNDVDSETRALLDQLRDDLDRVAPEDDALGHRLREAGRQFAAEHPQLSRLVERVAETLASMGI